ncbi:S8 family peptidase [Flavobacterium sp. HNIBRBA15423]|uniref:S8 family peptidase n=1 Tax=Flavobacterium sp. HNIBRBA15423 TaxID=3458683 RepID=UPI004044DA0B
MRLIIVLIIVLIGCKPLKKNDLNKTTYKKWHLNNSLNGISLNKWHKENPKKIKEQIVIAVLDTQIDTNHEDLQDQFWVNIDEIPNNTIDDDNNGYIDDVNGWNFLGTKSGNYIVWANFEYVRFIRDWKEKFEGKKKEDVEDKDLENFKIYSRCIAVLNYKKKYYENNQKSLDYDIFIYPKAKDTLKYYFPNEDYNYEKLANLYNKVKGDDKRTYSDMLNNKDEDFLALVYNFYSNYASNITSLEILQDKKIQTDSILKKNLNIDYNERVFIGDNPNILEKGYGNNKINAKIKEIRSFNTHSTEVSSIMASIRSNGLGSDGFSNNIKIMPLTISASGDEHDKDIAMAIYYAVDNGAKVINMSFGKDFSLHKEWVFEAMQYAENKNVLLVHCSSNDSRDIDRYHDYPNDIGYNKLPEVVDNFISVGSISKRTDSTMVSSFSNYGKKNVDIFAPGEEIYVAIPDNQYKYDSGTSLAAPMVSGTAALIWLYYPNLTVQEVKNIILESGVTIDKMVIKPGTKDEMVHFSELCKTGKILNTYNAMKMAEEVSKRNK